MKGIVFYTKYGKISYYHINKILEDILDILICMEVVYEVEPFNLVTGGNVLTPNDKTSRRNREMCYNSLYYKI